MSSTSQYQSFLDDGNDVLFENLLIPLPITPFEKFDAECRCSHLEPIMVNKYAAGIDLPIIPQAVELSPTQFTRLKTNLRCTAEFTRFLKEKSLYLRLEPKSTSFEKFYVHSGIIDADYKGELFIKVLGKEKIRILFCEPVYIAQVILCKNYWSQYFSSLSIINVLPFERENETEGAMTKKACFKIAKDSLLCTEDFPDILKENV